MSFQQSSQMDFHRPSSTVSVDRKSSSATAYFDESTEILDDAILETSIMSPANSNTGLFSPTENFWDENMSTSMADRTATSSTNPFFEHNTNNPWRTSMPVNQNWAGSDGNSGTRTPTAAKPFDSFAQEFGTGSNAFSMPVTNTANPFANLGNTTINASGNNVRPSSVFSSSQTEVTQPQPMSPHSNKEWMEMAAQQMDTRPGGPKRMRPNTPPRYPSPFPRRDGIRKKNARFEIPAERSLSNIDMLISNSKDEEEIKELKQQKRLLRNRQAALDSRQRKKKHTEELEEEKKLWTEQMTRLEEELANTRLQMESYVHEKDHWYHQALEAKNSLNALQMQHEELVRSTTIETGELRKKVSVLTEELQHTSSAMASVPSSAGLTDFTSDMDNLHMGAADWDNYIFTDSFCGDQATPQPTNVSAQPENTIVLSHRKKDSTIVSEDKPVASGLLLMLLLCGAFVASKSSETSSPPIPRMPDDVRAASATVLDSIFKDAGVGPSPASLDQQTQSLIANRIQELEAGPSGLPWAKSTTISGADLAAMASPDINTFQARFMQPSKAQENEQLFSISASQYNSLTSADFTRRFYNGNGDDMSTDGLSPGSQTSPHRRNLAETLAAMREESKGDTAAEVYTRSLLWERIPSEVVHEFKRMVEESDRISKSTPIKTEQ